MKKFELPTMYELCLMHARADRAMRTVVSKELENFRLTIMEWLALGAVVKGAKEGVSMSQIAHTLDVTLPQVTALVSNLLKSKMIKQTVLTSDRRGRQVTATLRGRRTFTKLESVIGGTMREWNKEISPTQLKAYLATVAKLANKA